MLIAYWIVAGLLAFMYLFSGGIKVVRTSANGMLSTQPIIGRSRSWLRTAFRPPPYR